eukprot:1736635-Karenia_brevis.AAC.1
MGPRSAPPTGRQWDPATGIYLYVKVLADADNVKSISVLWHAVIGGIQDPPLDVIAIQSQQLV